MPQRKIRVLHYGLSVNKGGIETYLFKVSRLINYDKFDFSFIDGTETKPAFHKELSALGCTFHKVTSRRKSYFQNRRDVEALFKTNNFDVLHVHVNTLSYIEPIMVALKYNVSVILHSRNAGARGSKITRFMHSINKFRLSRHADKIKNIAVSHLAGEWLFGKGEVFEVYNNGVDVTKFRFNLEGRDRLRLELGLFNTQPLLGCVAAFSPAKNQKFAVQVLALLLKHLRFNSAKLLFVGSGGLKEEVESLVNDLYLSDSVIFLENSADIPAIMSAMDLLLLPSFFEGFPNVVLEAQSCGLPCLISDRISDEVIVDNNMVKQISIDAGCETKWVDSVVGCFEHQVPISERIVAWERVQEEGFWTDYEIIKLEKLYSGAVTKRQPQESKDFH